MHIQENISLKSYNTFQIDAKAKFFVEIQNEKDIKSLVTNNTFLTNPRLILGSGANLLFTKDYEGLVIKINIFGKAIIKEDSENILIKVGAGEDWHETMMRMLKSGYVGGENLVYIPGTVGSAPIGNIGAYGKEAKDIIYEIEGIDLISGETKVLSNAECHFGYRDSIFKRDMKGRFLVTSVTFQVQKDSTDYKPDIQYKDIQEAIASQGLSQVSGLEVADMIIEIRKKKLPDRHDIGTAGSFFKNPIVTKTQYDELLKKYPNLIGRETHPATGSLKHVAGSLKHEAGSLGLGATVKLSAGQLIELAGLKGYRQGAVGISENHALILINYGNGTGSELVKLAETIQKKVLELFNVTLEPEVLYI